MSLFTSDRELDGVRVRFATFRTDDPEARERRAAAYRRLAVAERVLLDTCHRVELVSVDDRPVEADAVRGRAAVRRVFEVVAGFDSAVIAEEQLLGQVRDAYDAALGAGETGPILNELFRRALRFGRLVRSHARPGADRSLADRAVRWLTEQVPGPARVVVAGTGEMGRLGAARLARAGHAVTVVSRAEDRGRSVLAELAPGAHRLHVGVLDPTMLAGADGLLIAVRVRGPMITAAVLGPARPAVADLSAPSAVAPSAAELLGQRLLTLDAMTADGASAPVLADRVERRLRRQLEMEVEAFAAWLGARPTHDAVAALRREAEAIRRRHLDRLRGSAHLAPDQVAAVEAASSAMLNELLHRPSVELRAGAADAATVRRLFGIRGEG